MSKTERKRQMCCIEGRIDQECQHCSKTGGVKAFEGTSKQEKISLGGGRFVAVQPGQKVVVCVWCGVEQVPATTGWELQ